MPFDADDIAAFNDADMPGYALATIGAASVAGRFRSASVDALGVVVADRVQFSAAATHLAGVSVGTSITIAAVTYTVAEIMADDIGHGMTRLMLKT